MKIRTKKDFARLVTLAAVEGFGVYSIPDDVLAEIGENVAISDLKSAIHRNEKPLFWTYGRNPHSHCMSCGESHGASFFDDRGRCEVKKQQWWNKVHKLFFERRKHGLVRRG